jgi:hypothetical protein
MQNKEYYKEYRKQHLETILKRGREYYKKNRVQRLQKARERYNKLSLIMDRLKINGCSICGYNKCNASLDFHHVNPQNKKFSVIVSNLIREKHILIEELNKCILVCKNCHYEIEFCNKEVNNNVIK